MLSKESPDFFIFSSGLFSKNVPRFFYIRPGGGFSSLASRLLFRCPEMFFFYAMSCPLPLFPNIVVMVLLGVIWVCNIWGFFLWCFGSFRLRWSWRRRRVWRSRNHRFFYYREYRARWRDILAIALFAIYHFCCHLICPYIFTLLLSCLQ